MKYYRVLQRISFLFFLFLGVVAFAQQRNEIKLAENLLRFRNYEGALIIFQKHYDQGNTTSKIVKGVSLCLKELGQTEEMITFLKDVTKKVPDIFSYSIDLGRAYFLNDQPDSAMQTWQEVYSFEPPHLMRHRMVAQTMTSFRLFDDAINVYSRALNQIPNQEAIHLDIATLYKAQLNYEQAAEHYLVFYQRFKKQRNYVKSLLINMAKDNEAADRIIITILDFNNDNDPDLNELLANLYIRKKDYEKAFEIVVEIENSLPNSNLVYLTRFANEAAKDNSHQYVIKAYEYALQNVGTKLTSVLRLKLAQAYYNSALDLTDKGHRVKSDEMIKKSLVLLEDLKKSNAIEKYNAYEISADIYKKQFNDLDLALENYGEINLKKVGAINADNIRLKIADTYLLKNNLVETEKFYKQVKSKKYLPLAQFHLAELQYFKAQFESSKTSYEKIISWVGMKDSLANNAMERKLQIEQFLEDSLNFAKFSHASLLKRQQKFSEAAKEFKELYFASNLTSFTAGMEAVVLYNRLNKEVQSSQILQDIIKSYPDEDKTDYAYFLLANNYKKQTDLENALAIYQEILIRFPTSFYIEQAREFAREINGVLQEINN